MPRVGGPRIAWARDISVFDIRHDLIPVDRQIYMPNRDTSNGIYESGSGAASGSETRGNAPRPEPQGNIVPVYK